MAKIVMDVPEYVPMGNVIGKDDNEVDENEYPYELKRVHRLESASLAPVMDGDALIAMSEYWHDSEYQLPPVLDISHALKMLTIAGGTTFFSKSKVVDPCHEYEWRGSISHRTSVVCGRACATLRARCL